MFSYGFGISFNLNGESRKPYISLGSGEPQYPMLNQLSQYNSVSVANEVIEELSAVISGEKTEWGWGIDKVNGNSDIYTALENLFKTTPRINLDTFGSPTRSFTISLSASDVHLDNLIKRFLNIPETN